LSTTDGSIELGTLTIYSDDVGEETPASLECDEGILIHSELYVSLSSNDDGSPYEALTVEDDKVYVEGERVHKTDAGTVSVSASWASVSFGFTFDAAPKVVATYAQNASSTDIAPLKTQSVTTTGFQISMATGSSTGTRYADWIAVGN